MGTLFVITEPKDAAEREFDDELSKFLAKAMQYGASSVKDKDHREKCEAVHSSARSLMYLFRKARAKK